MPEEDATRTDFGRQVRDALLHLHDLPHLQRHPIIWLLRQDAGTDAARRGKWLQDRLAQAIDGLLPVSIGLPPERLARRQALMRLRYVEALDVAQVCMRIGVSKAEYYREHRDGLSAVVTLLRADDTFSPPHPAAVPAASSESRFFVGREESLAVLKEAFHRASVGESGLALVSGEPGIGKSALCLELARWVQQHGGQVVTGRCYEQTSLSMTYLPLVEALQMYVQVRPLDAVKNELGDLAPHVAEFLPALGLQPAPVEEGGSGRFKLFQSAAVFLRNASAEQSCLLLLEDLQDADRQTLEMLTYVLRNLAGARLLIVGTYRDAPLDRTQPLFMALEPLHRGALLGRVSLKGLDREQVGLLLERITGQPQTDVAAMVYQQTEGNPLFVQEVLRYLREEGHPASISLARLRVPEGIRQVIASRLSHLSAPCLQLLSLASVLGQEFEFDTLAALVGRAGEVLFDSIEEALDAGMVSEIADLPVPTYAFTHALLRQVLYEGLSLPRRQRLHLQAAQALEAIEGDGPESSVALASHYRLAGSAADPLKLQQYSMAAAETAAAVFATALLRSARSPDPKGAPDPPA